MGILDSVLGSVMGGGGGNSALSPILADILGGGGAGGGQGASQPGIMGLVERFAQAGHGNTVNSWVGNGPNQPIEPNALQNVFGQNQINQWSQQTGMAPNDLLGQLAQFLPHAVNQMTPNGQVPTSAENLQGGNSGSPFDGPGMA